MTFIIVSPSSELTSGAHDNMQREIERQPSRLTNEVYQIKINAGTLPKLQSVIRPAQTPLAAADAS
jgi:hypothetical protein